MTHQNKNDTVKMKQTQKSKPTSLKVTTTQEEENHFQDPTQDKNETTTTTRSDVPSWLRTIAIFGDSSVALAVSFALWLLAVGVAIQMNPSTPPDIYEEAYKSLGPPPKIGPPTIYKVSSFDDKDEILVTPAMKQAFDTNGVIAIRGLIPNDLLDRLDVASQPILSKKSKPKEKILTGRKKSPSQFHTVEQGAIFRDLSHNNNDDNSTTTAANNDAPPRPPFYQVALRSKIPQVAAELLQLGENKEKNNLRVLRDIFLAKDDEEYVCGWHVDDTGFWPATHEAPGVNAWIALDDMPIQGGGGFALAVGSHVAPWRQAAYNVTGSTHTFPPQGFTSASDLLDNRMGNGTCNIATSAPHLHRRMEDTKRIYDVQRGDVIFHTRWLFHRTVPFERSAVEERQQQEPPLVYRRFSVRYGPGSSEIPRGFGMEPSVLWDVHNGGRTADEVAQQDAAWYPQAWPRADEYQQMQMIASERLPQVTEKSKAIRKQLQRQRSKNQNQRYNRQPH